jgi:hypothetical protein
MSISLPPIDFHDWICKVCHRYNHKQRSVCSSCRSHKYIQTTSTTTAATTTTLPSLPGTPAPMLNWRCLLCHGQNAVALQRCKYCVASRPPINAVYHTWLPRVEQGEWQCDVCDSIYKASQRICVKCNCECKS